MDLNLLSKSEAFYTPSWLPRGAMDLNCGKQNEMRIVSSWLPRGAMDLNIKVKVIGTSGNTLAPSWSHGSKYKSK